SLKWIDTIEICANRGASLIQQILVFSKGAGGDKALLQTSFLLSETKKILQDTIPKSIDISVGISNDLWNIMGESTQLQQVLMNLCVNARDAMPTGGILKISAENLYLDRNYAQIHIDAHTGPYVVITVSDTGTGIAPEIMDRMFEPFFTTKDPGKGTGLGLSTAYRIIKDHGGFISVQSKKGLGTEFKLYLPAIETNETKQATYDYDRNTPLGNGELVLVVDDEEAVLDITKLTLEAFGYQAITADDGAEAVGVYAQNKDNIKAVILDMMMPIMEGSTTIRALKKINPDIKIIAVSGLIDTKAILTSGNITVAAFLNKPYTSRTLMRTMHEVVGLTKKPPNTF
ncbi:MAG: ATP-binding protein, partial [Thermodesulfobacteriota bacterium]